MRLLSIAAALLAVLLSTSGCPKNACFLKVCQGGQCSCPLSTCMEGAEYDTTENGCLCTEGRLMVEGQCLTKVAADAYCGEGFHYGDDGCTSTRCPEDQLVDQATGKCIAAEQVKAVASKAGVEIGEGEKLGCPAGKVLIIEGDEAGCVPAEQSCAPDEGWDGQRCTKLAHCTAGSAYDRSQQRCVQYATAGDNAAVINVAQWTQTNFGPDGGKGNSAFCNKFARKPWHFGVPEGQSATVLVKVSLSFAGESIAKARVHTAPSYRHNPTPVPTRGAEAVSKAAEAIIDTLRHGGGKASAPTATTTVHCTVVHGGKPVVVPATGGV